MNRSSSSFEDSVRVTENFLRPPKSDCDAEDAVVALDEIDAFLTEYVRLFDQGLLEKKNESESLIDGEEFVSGTYFWPKKTKTKEEDEEDNKEEEEKREKTKKKRMIIERYCERLAKFVAEEQKLSPLGKFCRVRVVGARRRARRTSESVSHGLRFRRRQRQEEEKILSAPLDGVLREDGKRRRDGRVRRGRVRRHAEVRFGETESEQVVYVSGGHVARRLSRRK